MDEVAITCGPDGVCAWQLRSGSALQTLKNTQSATFTLCGSSQLLSPQENKPILHAYTLSKDSIAWKAPVAEKMISITASPHGRYCCAGGASGMIYMWDAYTGLLVAQWAAHFNEILALAFAGGQEMLVSAGKDSMVHCWLLSQVFGSTDVTPYRSWSGHALPVTSLTCTASRVLTASLDHTCKLWAFHSEAPLSSLVFPSAITCAIMDQGETVVYAGSNDCAIYAVDLLGSERQPHEQTFQGHTKPVTSVSLSLDGTILLSTSLDGSIKLWDTKSFQLIRNLTHHSGPVTTSKISLMPRCLFEENTPTLYQVPFAPFKKYAAGEGAQKIAVTTSNLPIRFSAEDEAKRERIPTRAQKDSQEEMQVMQEKVVALEDQLQRWKTVSHQLYQMQVDSTVL